MGKLLARVLSCRNPPAQKREKRKGVRFTALSISFLGGQNACAVRKNVLKPFLRQKKARKSRVGRDRKFFRYMEVYLLGR